MKQKPKKQCQKKPLFILTGNHNSIMGINDHIEIIKRSFKNQFEITLSEGPVPGHHNLIIEEFTTPWFNTALRNALESSSKTKLHLLMTEFPSGSKKNLKLNNFDSPSKSIIITLANALVPIFRSQLKSIRKLRESIGLLSKGVAWVYRHNPLIPRVKSIKLLVFNLVLINLTPLIIKLLTLLNLYHIIKKIIRPLVRSLYSLFKNYIIKSLSLVSNLVLMTLRPLIITLLTLLNLYHIIKKIIRPLVRSLYSLFKNYQDDVYYHAYMYERAKALEKNIGLFHSFIDMHPDISKAMLSVLNCHSVTLLPPLGKDISPSLKSNEKNKNIYLTGAITVYRRKIFKKLCIQSNEISNGFNLVSKGFISDQDLQKNASFTINIPQSDKWSYSSPVRIYRSYNVNKVPIVYKKFNDHPLEKCSILWSDFINITDLNIKIMEERLKRQISSYLKYQSKCYSEIIVRMTS